MSDFVKAHSSPPKGMVFYNSLESVRQDATMLGFVSVVERAWHEMKLSGVLCLENRPILYLKEYNRTVSSTERLLIQKRFWNQGVANVLVMADPSTVYVYSGLAEPQKDISATERESALIKTITLTDYIQQIQSFYHELATGHYYDKNKPY